MSQFDFTMKTMQTPGKTMAGSLYQTPKKFQGSIAEGSSPRKTNENSPNNVREVIFNPGEMKSALKVKQE